MPARGEEDLGGWEMEKGRWQDEERGTSGLEGAATLEAVKTELVGARRVQPARQGRPGGEDMLIKVYGDDLEASEAVSSLLAPLSRCRRRPALALEVEARSIKRRRLGKGEETPSPVAGSTSIGRNAECGISSSSSSSTSTSSTSTSSTSTSTMAPAGPSPVIAADGA